MGTGDSPTDRDDNDDVPDSACPLAVVAVGWPVDADDAIARVLEETSSSSPLEQVGAASEPISLSLSLSPLSASGPLVTEASKPTPPRPSSFLILAPADGSTSTGYSESITPFGAWACVCAEGELSVSLMSRLGRALGGVEADGDFVDVAAGVGGALP